MASWIFQDNPDKFDLDGYLASSKEIVWTVNQAHLASRMTLGDRVYLWRAAGAKRGVAGVIAEAVIVEEPRTRLEDAASEPFWRVRADSDERLRVGLRLLRVANEKQVLRREWLREDPVLRDLMILRLAQQTNYLLDGAHGQRLDTLWRNTNRDWNRAETVAGLWAYNRTLNSAISKLPGSPVADVALRIGRAVQGVYNKVMNFRALDPRDERAGFSGGGALAEEIWREFYDPQAQALRSEQLDAEYARLWPSPEGLQVVESMSPSLSIRVEDAWDLVRSAAAEAVGRGDTYESTKRGQRYRIASVEDRRIWVSRLDSANPEYVSAGEVERAIRIVNDAGGRVRRREMNYTVAKEVAIVALHPRLDWSADKDWIEAKGRSAAVTTATTTTYGDFGQAPNDDPAALQHFARKVRAGQPKFRQNLLKLYEGRCAVSGWGPETVLEAAHILWHADSGLNHTDNGIVLRSDLHILFDSGLLRVDPDTLTVKIDPSLRGSPYWPLNDTALRPRRDGSQPGLEYLRERWGLPQHV